MFESKIVNAEGLTDFQMKTLEIIENDFFKDVELNHDRMLELMNQFKKEGCYNGREFMELMDFYRFINKAKVKTSYYNPIDLADYFEPCDKNHKDSFWIHTNDMERYHSTYALEKPKLIADLGELKEFYDMNFLSFEREYHCYCYKVCNGNLYIDANTIISSKMIAVVKYKPEFWVRKEISCMSG